MDVSDGKTYEMMWDCGACGTPKLLAKTHRHCPTCGSPQDPTWRYFPPDDEKVAVEDHQFVGKDKVCDACGTPNSADAGFCGACGSDLDTAREAGTRAEQSAAEGQSFAEDDADKAAAEHRARQKAAREAKEQAQREAHGAPPKSSGGGAKKLAIVAAGMAALIAVIACIGIFTWKKEAVLINTGHSWARTIEVEQKKTVTESAWDDEVPRGATVQSCSKQKRSTKKVADGQTCSTKRKDNGDGTFTEREVCKTKYRSEPVYGQKCRYSIDKWVTSRTAKASGKGMSPEPHWPDPKLKKTGNCLGCEREGSKKETYTLTFKDTSDKKVHSCNVKSGVWKKVKPKTKWKGKIGVVTGSLDCSDLTAAK